MSALAERLRHAVANRDVAELAANVGVTPVTFYRWLSAKFDPGVVKLNELAEVLDVSLAWLITGQGPGAPTRTSPRAAGGLCTNRIRKLSR